MHRRISDLIAAALFLPQSQVLLDFLEIDLDGPAQGVGLEDRLLVQARLGAQKHNPGVGLTYPNWRTENQTNRDPPRGLLALGRQIQADRDGRGLVTGLGAPVAHPPLDLGVQLRGGVTAALIAIDQLSTLHLTNPDDLRFQGQSDVLSTTKPGI